MKKGLVAYSVVLLAAIVLQYAVELYLPWKPVLGSWSALPWAIDILSFALFGGVAWVALRPWSTGSRIAMMALIAVLPHALIEITHGSDPAYPYIGLLLIVPDLLWVALGAVIALLFSRKPAAKGQP